jgi:NAD(P)-dependent dehydrogenase (short-subunit alcohol dehydrogenase family)
VSDEFAIYPSLRGQVAFVTGGATGLGAEFVAQLAAQAVHVGFVDVEDDAGRALAARVAEHGHPPPLFQRCDVMRAAGRGSGRTTSASTA